MSFYLSPKAEAFAPHGNIYSKYDNLHYWLNRTNLSKEELQTMIQSYEEWADRVENSNASQKNDAIIDQLFDTWQPLAQKGDLEISDLELLAEQDFFNKRPSVLTE